MLAVPAEDGLTRLRRFIDEEVSMARAYRYHARSAPPAARRVLLRMAEEEFSHGRDAARRESSEAPPVHRGQGRQNGRRQKVPRQL